MSQICHLPYGMDDPYLNNLSIQRIPKDPLADEEVLINFQTFAMQAGQRAWIISSEKMPVSDEYWRDLSFRSAGERETSDPKAGFTSLIVPSGCMINTPSSRIVSRSEPKILNDAR